ncbi:MAG: hypothetical protein LUD12_01725 [Lachnospiraceae bacterium]|nr:hypothetical protein [Lachnospiraceae bacterium]
MAYHKPWTNSDLIEDMIAQKYPGYTELHTFQTVMHGGEFYAVSLIQKGESRMAIFSQRRCDGYCFYFETKKTIEFTDKAEGNSFFKRVSATKRASKRGFYYYRY